MTSCRTARPARPSTSWPPAASTISGTQCPAANGGSDHSHTKTSLRPRPATAVRTAARRRCISSTIARPRSATPRRTASSSTLAPISSIVCGSSEMTSASSEPSRPTSALDTAQTAHRSCVTTMSGASASIWRSSSTYSESPVRSAARTLVIDRTSRESRRVDARARHDRQRPHRRRPVALLRDADEASRRDRARRRSRWRSGGASRCGCPWSAAYDRPRRWPGMS